MMRCHLNIFSIFSSGGNCVIWRGTICAIIENIYAEGIMGNIYAGFIQVSLGKFKDISRTSKRLSNSFQGL